MSSADNDPKDAGPSAAPRPNLGIVGISICGTAASAAKLVAMTKARRSGSSSELKVTKTVPILTSAKDFIIWRTMILGLFVPYVGGRYWHLLENDPSTSVEAYQYIFADTDDQPIDRDEAITHRTADLISIHGLLLQTLHADVLQSVDEETSSGNFDGYRLWVALTSKYGGKDLGSKSAAENAIKDFQLGALTVTEASQQLQALFTQVFISSGRPYPEKFTTGTPPQAISLELKEHIVQLEQKGLDLKTLLEGRYSLSTHYRAKRRLRASQDAALTHKKRSGRSSLLTPGLQQWLLQLIRHRPTIQASEIRRHFDLYAGIKVHDTTVTRWLARMKITRKQLSRRARQRDELRRISYRLTVAQFHPSQLVFADETHTSQRTG
ncbi:hypothetical protein V8E36_007254 [Tilletia maclaganii]